MNEDCIFYRSVSKLEDIGDCNRVCGNSCMAMKRYKELLDEGKIDIIYDLANFRSKKHQDKKKRSVKNASNNRCNSKRTISKSRKNIESESKKKKKTNV